MRRKVGYFAQYLHKMKLSISCFRDGHLSSKSLVLIIFLFEFSAATYPAVNLNEPILKQIRAEAAIFVNKKELITVQFLQMPIQGDPVTVVVSQPPKTVSPTPGPHGMHVHRWGNLVDGCPTMGPHFNPDLVPHGDQTDWIRHVGDLGNIYLGIFQASGSNVTLNAAAKKKYPNLEPLLASRFSAAGGKILYNFTDDRISLVGRNSILGRGLIVHKLPDDLGKGGTNASFTEGNAGEPLGCAVIGRLAPISISANRTGASNAASTPSAVKLNNNKLIVENDVAKIPVEKKLVSLNTENDKLDKNSVLLDEQSGEDGDDEIKSEESVAEPKRLPTRKRRPTAGESSKFEKNQSKNGMKHKSKSSKSRKTKIPVQGGVKTGQQDESKNRQFLELVELMIDSWGEEVAKDLILEAFDSEEIRNFKS